ncbi:MAG: GAF domain-containing protein [Acidobacteriia bacterium]|nr:GAF domain-containing protein [Terriglobia bacterium]
MVSRAKPGRLSILGTWALALACLPAGAQTRLTLAEVNARRAPDFTPAHAGAKVAVRGIVNARAFHFPNYTMLAIEDGHSGAVLDVAADDARLNGWEAGDEIEVEGTVSSVAGLVTISPARIDKIGRREPPAAIEVAARALQGFRYLGRLVRTSGRMVETDTTTAGPYMLIAAQGSAYRLFCPAPRNQPAGSITGFKPDDTVQATGVALQYCPYPPFNARFELLLAAPSDIVLTERGWFFPPVALVAGLSVVLLGSFVLWNREHRLRNQRERLQRTYQLGEEVLGGASAETILERIGEALPGILGVTRVHLYIYNRAAQTLDAVAAGDGAPASISLSSPPGGTAAGAVACFHYRTLLVIPDIDRSPFPLAAKSGDGAPKSLLFVPMLAQGEVIGVLELDQDNHVHDFTADEQAMAQHLGNQIGVSLRLLDQRSVQEQLFRTEKMAAVGRLISGVVNELQTPLASISDLAQRALERAHGGLAEREVAAIASEARKAAAMVARLVSFAAAGQGDARPVCINTLLRNLIEFRGGDWKASGIRVRDLTTREPICVVGFQGQLEQVFLNLLVHAEQSLAGAPQKAITIRTSVLGKRLVVEIAFTCPEPRKSEETATVLGVTRSVIAGHGGEVRLIEKSNADPRFEVELPVTPTRERALSVPSAGGSAADFSGRKTALVIEPDDALQRQMLGLLAARGYRVVPVNNSDTALELAQRMRFDAAFCSVHAPGLNWVELSERLQTRVGGFILLADGYDAELSADFEGEGRFVLPKPLQEPELERVLRALAPAPAAAGKHGGE